jgi:hypothetical protein
VRRRLIAGAVAVLALALAAHFLLFGETKVEPKLRDAVPTSVIGSGEDAVGVSANGVLLASLPAPEDGMLPALPLAEPPAGGRLSGPVLEQARVLGAAPTAIRPCIGGSRYGESGVDVELRSGIELRFGDASRVDEKWRSAVAVLADPSIVALDYVDLHSPGRPAVYGEGHVLPSVDESSGGTCGE